MSIEVLEPVTVAEVTVTDDYCVEVVVSRPLTPPQAIEFASEIIAAAGEAVRMVGEDFPVSAKPAHGFDVPPICTWCEDGEHDECVESAYQEIDGEIAEVDCGCWKAKHDVQGRAA